MWVSPYAPAAILWLERVTRALERRMAGRGLEAHGADALGRETVARSAPPAGGFGRPARRPVGGGGVPPGGLEALVHGLGMPVRGLGMPARGHARGYGAPVGGLARALRGRSVFQCGLGASARWHGAFGGGLPRLVREPGKCIYALVPRAPAFDTRFLEPGMRALGNVAPARECGGRNRGLWAPACGCGASVLSPLYLYGCRFFFLSASLSSIVLDY